MLFDPSDASIDYHDENDIGRGWKLVKKARNVLKEYYGDDWESNPDAKVIFIGHSMGAPSIRYALEYDPVLADHTYKVITIGGVHQGSVWATPGVRDVYIITALNYPMIWLTGRLVEEFGEWVAEKLFITGIEHSWPEWITEALGGLVEASWFGQGQISSLGSLIGFTVFVDATAIISTGVFGYKEGVWDLSSFSGCMGKLNNETEAPEDVEYVFIVGKGGLADWIMWSNDALGAYMLLAAYCPAVPNPLGISPLQATLSASSAVFYHIWNENSDLVVQWESQDPRDVYAFSRVSREKLRSIVVDGIWHGAETSQWRAFVEALENPPTLDSVMLVERKEGDVDTTYLRAGVVDTLIASPESSSIYFKLDNVYFLAQTRLSININGVRIGNLSYPEYKGYDGRWCRIPAGVKDA